MTTAMKLSTFNKLNSIFYEVINTVYEPLDKYEVDIKNKVDHYIEYELSDNDGNLLLKSEIKDE